MKTLVVNKDINYSLHSNENYKKELESSVDEVIDKFSILLIEYYKFIIENIKVKNKNFGRFIIIRGLDTITNVFLNLLLQTRNLDITYFHCQKSFYFYVEFVGQISEDEKMFLQLSSRDATTYVYKKTIFEMKKINEEMSKTTQDKIEIVNLYINLYKTFINKIVKTDNYDNETKYIDNVETILNKLNKNVLDKRTVNILNDISDKLYYNIDNCYKYLDLNDKIIKKIIKNNGVFNNYENKLLSEDFLIKLNDSNDKFIAWLSN